MSHTHGPFKVLLMSLLAGRSTCIRWNTERKVGDKKTERGYKLWIFLDLQAFVSRESPYGNINLLGSHFPDTAALKIAWMEHPRHSSRVPVTCIFWGCSNVYAQLAPAQDSSQSFVSLLIPMVFAVNSPSAFWSRYKESEDCTLTALTSGPTNVENVLVTLHIRNTLVWLS